MKKVLLSVCLLALLLPAKAQDNRGEVCNHYRPNGLSIEATASTGIFDIFAVELHQKPYLLTVGPTLYYRFNKNISLGLGTEFQASRGSRLDYNFDEYLMGIPVFASFKVNMGGQNTSPFFAARVGMIFDLNSIVEEYDYFYEGSYYDQPWGMYNYDKYRYGGIYTDLGFGLSVKRSNISLGIICSDLHFNRYHEESHYLSNGEVETTSGSSENIEPNINFYVRYSYTIPVF